jgi:hypothetical protein
MTTDAFEHSGPTQTSGAGRLGALAGVTPIVMFIGWTFVSRWSGSTRDFLVALAAICAVAVIAGWIVGCRSGGSIRSGLLDVVAYPAVAWLIWLPIGVLLSTLSGVADGTVSDPAAAIASKGFLLLYGLVSSLYVIPLMTPFGAGWAVTYYALRRGMPI